MLLVGVLLGLDIEYPNADGFEIARGRGYAISAILDPLHDFFKSRSIFGFCVFPVGVLEKPDCVKLAFMGYVLGFPIGYESFDPRYTFRERRLLCVSIHDKISHVSPSGRDPHGALRHGGQHINQKGSHPIIRQEPKWFSGRGSPSAAEE